MLNYCGTTKTELHTIKNCKSFLCILHNVNQFFADLRFIWKSPKQKYQYYTFEKIHFQLLWSNKSGFFMIKFQSLWPALSWLNYGCYNSCDLFEKWRISNIWTFEWEAFCKVKLFVMAINLLLNTNSQFCCSKRNSTQK